MVIGFVCSLHSCVSCAQLFYLGFLMFYSYVVLVKMPKWPSPQEWVVILYIFTSAIEKIREVCGAEPSLIFQMYLARFLNQELDCIIM